MQSSTRQAFVPSRPASRASHLVDQTQLAPSLANAQPSQPDNHSESAYPAGAIKPLNISGLRRQSQSKSQSSQRQPQFIESSLSPIQVSNTATNMRLMPQQVLNIAQPRPSSPAAFFSLANLGASTFKVPTVPPSKYIARPPSAVEVRKSTHVSTENGFSARHLTSMDSDTSNSNSTTASTLVAPPVTKFRPRSSTVSASLEQIRESVEEDELQAHAQVPFGRDGPQRIMLPSEPSASRDEFGTNEIAYFAGGVDGHRPLRRSKRTRSKTMDDDDDNNFGFGIQVKRSKEDGTEIDQEASMAIHAEDRRFVEQEQPYRHTSDNEVIENKASISRKHRYSQSREDAPPAYQPPHPSYTHTPPSFVRPAVTIPENPLRQLFSTDFDTFVNANTDLYEMEQKRWEGCTMEEWVAGADEIAQKTGKVLDFVKGHMTQKLTLWATAESNLTSHNLLLDERHLLLVEAQESMVKESGAVLGQGRGSD